MPTKTWKRTEAQVTVKLAPQAKIVLNAIDELKIADMKEWGAKCVELGLATVQGTDRIIAWYKPTLLQNGLIEELPIEKPIKEKKTKVKATDKIDKPLAVIELPPTQEAIEQVKSAHKANKKVSKK